MSLMLLKDFFQIFPEEESCIDYFRQIREDVGITCPKCGYTDHKWLDGRKAFQCKNCGYPTPLTKGTVMERSHIPLYELVLYSSHDDFIQASPFCKRDSISIRTKRLPCSMADDDEVP